MRFVRARRCRGPLTAVDANACAVSIGMLNTWLTREWSLGYPLIGAPMANVALGRLARAVTDAGALGSIGIGADDPLERIASEAATARGDDDAKFCIGTMVWALERRPELFDAVLAEKPFLVSLSFGDVVPYVARARAAGCRIAAQVQTRDDALAADAAHVDLIVVQGTEAGGHTGSVGTLPLLQIVLDLVRAPVVAAGGIATGRGMAAVLAAGAEGRVDRHAALGVSGIGRVRRSARRGNRRARRSDGPHVALRPGARASVARAFSGPRARERLHGALPRPRRRGARRRTVPSPRTRMRNARATSASRICTRGRASERSTANAPRAT